MLGEENTNTNDDNDETGLLDSIVCGINQIGVEIELNGSLLSSSTDDWLTVSDTMSVEETSYSSLLSISSPENEGEPSATLDHTPIDGPTAAEGSSSQPIRNTSNLRTLSTLRRQILKLKATSRIKLRMSPKKKKRNQRRTLYNSISSSSPPLSPKARDALKDDDNITNGKEEANNINDNATCCESSVASRNSNSPISTAQSLVHTPSSITASTCDFGQHNDPNRHAIFSNYH